MIQRPRCPLDILLLVLCAGFLPSCSDSPARTNRPNVLLLLVDDLNTRLGCYGDPVAKTPHIDRLAAAGLRFDRAYCQVPKCNPSRISLLTSRRPRSTGVHSNTSDPSAALRDHPTIPTVFSEAGYNTIRLGKITHRTDARENTLWTHPIQTSGESPELSLPKRPVEGPGADRDRYYPATFTGDALSWGVTGASDENEMDGQLARQAEFVLSQPHDRPFLLAVGLVGTHLPFTAPQAYFDLYREAKILPPSPPADDLEDTFQTDGPDENILTPEWKEEVIRAYYACISFVDAQVGRILDALERTGHADDTIVILVSDHGMHLGEHFQWRKGTLFEEATRVPFLVVAPGVTRPGGVCPEPVELLDLFPTLVDLCNVPRPASLEGRSLGQILRNPDAARDGTALTEIYLPSLNAYASSLRTGRHRYTEWGSRSRVELYDHATDPGEERNLAGNGAESGVVEELAVKLREKKKKRSPIGN